MSIHKAGLNKLSELKDEYKKKAKGYYSLAEDIDRIILDLQNMHGKEVVRRYPYVDIVYDYLQKNAFSGRTPATWWSGYTLAC